MKAKNVLVMVVLLAVLCVAAVTLSGCISREELNAELDAALLAVLENDRVSIDMELSVIMPDETVTQETTIQRTYIDGEEVVFRFSPEYDGIISEQYIRWGHVFSYDHIISNDENAVSSYYSHIAPLESGNALGGIVIINSDAPELDYSISKSKRSGQYIYKIKMGLASAFDMLGDEAGLESLRKYIEFKNDAEALCYVDADTGLLTNISMQMGFKIKKVGVALDTPPINLQGKTIIVSMSLDFSVGGDFVIVNTREMGEFYKAYSDSTRIISEEFYGESGTANKITVNNAVVGMEYYATHLYSGGGSYSVGYDVESGFVYRYGYSTGGGNSVDVFEIGSMKHVFSANYETFISSVQFTGNEMMVTTIPYQSNNGGLNNCIPKNYRILGYSLDNFSRTTDVTLKLDVMGRLTYVSFLCFNDRIFYIDEGDNIWSYNISSREMANTNLNYGELRTRNMWYDAGGDLLYLLTHEYGEDLLLTQYKGSDFKKIKSLPFPNGFASYTVAFSFDGEFVHYNFNTINKNLELVPDDIPATVHPKIENIDYYRVLCYGDSYDIVQTNTFTYLYSHQNDRYVAQLGSRITAATQLSDGKFFLFMGTESAILDTSGFDA